MVLRRLAEKITFRAVALVDRVGPEVQGLECRRLGGIAQLESSELWQGMEDLWTASLEAAGLSNAHREAQAATDAVEA